MKDTDTTIFEIRELLKDFRDKRNWSKYHKVKDLACAINIEAAELLDELIWKRDEEIEELLKDNKKREQIEMELADVVIYCLNLANRMDTDIAKAIEKKIKRNSEKYPEPVSPNS